MNRRFWIVMVVGLLLAWSRGARAEPPAWAKQAIVEVYGYEHLSLGVAVEGGWRILVPYETVEVNHPGPIDVVDANGHQKASVMATDKASGLALLAVERPIAVALALSPKDLGSPPLFAIETTSTLPSLTWQPYPPPPPPPPPPPSADPTRPRPPAPSHVVAPGSPVIDEEGGLVGLDRTAFGVMMESKGAILVAPSLARMTAPGPERARRSFIPYGGGSMQFDFSGNGGVWWGMTFSIGVRWRDLVELRADGAVTYLLPSAKHDECGEPPCFAGVRGVLTPSIGPHFSLGTGYPMGVTPSIGLALGAQVAYRGDGAPMSDVRAPNTWLMPAVGVSVTTGVAEIRARVRIPHGEMDTPSFELGCGLAF